MFVIIGLTGQRQLPLRDRCVLFQHVAGLHLLPRRLLRVCCRCTSRRGFQGAVRGHQRSSLAYNTKVSPAGQIHHTMYVHSSQATLHQPSFHFSTCTTGKEFCAPTQEDLAAAHKQGAEGQGAGRCTPQRVVALPPPKRLRAPRPSAADLGIAAELDHDPSTLHVNTLDPPHIVTMMQLRSEGVPVTRHLRPVLEPEYNSRIQLRHSSIQADARTSPLPPESRLLSGWMTSYPWTTLFSSTTSSA
jgi:hypothetical protein